MQDFRELPGFEEALAAAKVAASLSGEGLYRRPNGAENDLDDCPLCGQQMVYSLPFFTELLCRNCNAVADVALFRLS